MSSKVLATSHKQSYRPPRLVERVADDLDVELREVGPVAAEVLLRVAGCAAGSRRVSGRAQHKRVSAAGTIPSELHKCLISCAQKERRQIATLIFSGRLPTPRTPNQPESALLKRKN